MTERHFNTKFLAWLRSEKLSGAFELKLSKNDAPIPFTSWKSHQRESLLAVKHGYIAQKIADDSIGFKAFDCFGMGSLPAYAVAIYYRPRDTSFYLIDIDDLLSCETLLDRPRKDGGSKSLTEEMAAKIGKLCTLKVEKTPFI